MCIGFMSLRAPPAALKLKNYHNSTNMQPIITHFQGRFKFMKRHILVNIFKIIERVLSLLYACFIFPVFLFLINCQ